jgi:hypothetical protein
MDGRALLPSVLDAGSKGSLLFVSMEALFAGEVADVAVAAACSSKEVDALAEALLSRRSDASSSEG